MKQLLVFSIIIFSFSACNLNIGIKECPNVILDLSKKTKEWISPLKNFAGDTIYFSDATGTKISFFIQNFANTAFQQTHNQCPLRFQEDVINYFSLPPYSAFTNQEFSIIGMAQIISFLPSSNFCDVNAINKFNTQNAEIESRSGLLNYQIINDFDFHGEKLKAFHAIFSLSSDNCVTNYYQNVSEFWVSNKYGLIQFKDKTGVTWVLDL